MGMSALNNDLMFWTWWAWEPIYFYRRMGQVFGVSDISNDNLDKWYAAVHSEDVVASMRKIGVNCAITHFYKGFGLEYEKQEMRRTADLVRLCHKHEMKVFGYIQYGTIFHETLFREVPEAANWIQLDSQGRPLLWWGEKSRYMPCIHRPGFLSYIKDCIKFGIETIGLDGLHFDNFYSRPCYCPVCRQKFRDYLKDNCSEKFDELGVESADAIEMPEETVFSYPLADAPLVRAWCEFRKQAMNELMSELYAYARFLKNDIMLLSNPSTIRGLLDQGAMRSTDIWQIGTRAQYLWAEGGNYPGIRKNCLVHQVNYFKTAEAIGYRVLSTTWKHNTEGIGLPDSKEDIGLNQAESAAFGAEPGDNWLLRPTKTGEIVAGAEKHLTDELSKYYRFIKENADVFSASRSLSGTALYLSETARYSNYRRTYGAFLTAQQIILQNNIQFDLLFSEQSERLTNYSCVIIVDAEKLASSEIMHLKTYLNSGGKLFLAGNCDPRLLAEVNMTNNGNIRYCQLSCDWSECVKADYTTYVYLPSDAQHFVTALRDLAGYDMCEINAPNYVFSEVRRCQPNTIALHLINYQNTVFAHGATVGIDANQISVETHAVLLNPDNPAPKSLTGISKNNTILYKIPPFKTYCILKLTENGPHA